MARCPSQSYDAWFDDQCDAAMMACFECAKSHGKTQEEAENCDDGDVGCPDCPFMPEERRKK